MLTTLLAGIAVGIALMALYATNRRPQTVIYIQAEHILPGSKGLSLPPFIDQPQTIPTEKYSLSIDYGGHNASN